MNGADYLPHASKFKSDEDKVEHSTGVQFKTVTNSSRRHEG
jgi:hypothetical protein